METTRRRNPTPPETTKTAGLPRPLPQSAMRRGADAPRALLDLRFAEDDVLAHHRVVLLEFELAGGVPDILLGHVEEAGLGAADELDLDGVGLGHNEAFACLLCRAGGRARTVAPGAVASRESRRRAVVQRASAVS